MPKRRHVALEKMVPSAADDQPAKIHTTSTYQSLTDRDSIITSGTVN